MKVQKLLEPGIPDIHFDVTLRLILSLFFLKDVSHPVVLRWRQRTAVVFVHGVLFIGLLASFVLPNRAADELRDVITKCARLQNRLVDAKRKESRNEISGVECDSVPIVLFRMFSIPFCVLINQALSGGSVAGDLFE
ncbi:hypothetical protein BSU04_31700 [Caballeronia sordidicola]|uniref:Uncharacterized protein n=1 Tax=Caballeronia sordidicola TaxID=196367 RepID=A0A226WUF4_CABSO|nr:hypothetical protein BSU04_31700 [Caballeronia sordidicola]